MRKVLEKIKTIILCSNNLLFEDHGIYEIMWKNIANPERPWMAT